MRWRRDKPDAIEADLRRFFHVQQPRDLTLVEVARLLRHLPAEAVLSGNDGYSLTDFLLLDLVHVQSGQPHPADPRAVRAREAKRAAVAAGAARAAARRERLGITGSIFRQAKE